MSHACAIALLLLVTTLLSGCRHPAPAGRIMLLDAQGSDEFEVLRDEFDMVDAAGEALRSLPRIEFEFVTVGDDLVPLQRGIVATGHPAWEYSVAPGRVWQGTNGGVHQRAAVPFSLHERNANCVHYGLLSFRIDDEGAVTGASYTLRGETCHYYKFAMRGRLEARYDPYWPAAAGATAQRYAGELSGRLMTRPIDAMTEKFPGARAGSFGSREEIDPRDMTAYGFVVDGVHFIGGCAPAPDAFCESQALPSYSLAKSLFAGLAVMRAEKLFPGISHTRIGDVVEACRGNPAWRDVTIAHALDMATGNYLSDAWSADEDAAVLDPFFLADDHAAKVVSACAAYPRRAEPGTRWVYHTSDTYLAGVALRAALVERLGRDVDLYKELLWQPVFEPLGLSPLARSIRRTYDDVAQPFFGWGMYFQPDDVAKLAIFLGPGRGRIDGTAVFDEAMFEAAMQRDPTNRGLPADMAGMVYKNGFRALDVAPYLGCEESAWVIVLSGYGGIIVALFPNETAYYYFSDGGTHRWLTAARESHRLRPFCASTTAADT